MANTIREFEAGTLHSGSKTGPVVKSRKKAIAIGLSEERAAGMKIPKPKMPKVRKPRIPKMMHPGDGDMLPMMHTSKHH